MAIKVAGILFAIAALCAADVPGKRTLVLVDDWSVRETHSVFFRSLRGKHGRFFFFYEYSLEIRIVHVDDDMTWHLLNLMIKSTNYYYVISITYICRIWMSPFS